MEWVRECDGSKSPVKNRYVDAVKCNGNEIEQSIFLPMKYRLRGSSKIKRSSKIPQAEMEIFCWRCKKPYREINWWNSDTRDKSQIIIGALNTYMNLSRLSRLLTPSALSQMKMIAQEFLRHSVIYGRNNIKH